MTGDEFVTWPAVFPRRSGPPSKDEKAAGGYEWAVLLFVDCGESGSRHLLRCPTEKVADGRAELWKRWRPEATVTVCRFVDGRWVPRD